MERESNPMQALCRSGCGFYGSPATDGLCSLCYKEALKKKQQLPTTPTSLSALRDTTTAHPTISRLPTSNVTDLPNESMSDRHLPSTASSTSNKSEEHVVPAAQLGSSSKHSVGTAELSPIDGGAVQSCSSSPVLIYPPSPAVSQPPGPIDRQQASEECPDPIQTAQSSSTEDVAAAAAAAAEPDAGSDDKDSDKDAKKKKNRCATCRKKVGLTGFECRCGGLFCAVHRYSDKHDCSFNYREMGAQEIRRNNPVVVGEKIQKI